MTHFKHEFSPEQECPRWDKCSVNYCPLDPDKKEHQPHPGDKEQKCPMEKGVRQRIGSKYAALLPLGGLTPKEAAGAAIWAKYPAARQWEMKEAAKERIRKVNDRRHPKT